MATPRRSRPVIAAKRWALVSAPITLGLERADPAVVPGAAQLPQALKAAGLAEAIGAEDAGEVPAPTQYDVVRDVGSGVRHVNELATYAVALADRVEEVVRGGRLPVVLGGDCSVVFGIALALKRIGRYGLVFIDGHSDFYPPKFSTTGGAAGMDLWIATGGEPAAIANVEGRRPLIERGDAVLVGHRDAQERITAGAPDPAASGLGGVFDLDAVRKLGADYAVDAILERLPLRDLDGIWVHIDADVLDDAVMPAVDARQPGGLSYKELTDIVRRLVGSRTVAGVDVTIFDPSRDPTGAMAQALSDALAAGLHH